MFHINDTMHKLKIILNELPPSINAIDKELRRNHNKDVQLFLDQIIAGELNDEDIKQMNAELNKQNYLLTKDLKGKWTLRDRSNAHESTYAARFKYYLENSNEKIKCIESLEEFTESLCQLDTFADLVDKTGVSLLDIGAGDGRVAAPMAKILNRSHKAKYIGIERDSKFIQQIEDKFESAAIPFVTYAQDFRKILQLLLKEQASIALASHLYTTTKMTEFLEMVFDILNENGVIILVHDTGDSDAVKFRSIFPKILQFSNNDYTKEIDNAFQQTHLNCITTTFESSLKFPELIDEDWEILKQIKQADYDNEYTFYSDKLRTTKNLIDFIISDKLEAFNDIERNEILDRMKDFLIQNNYQFKSLCKIQVALSPKHTLECEKQFLQLKEKIERPSKNNENCHGLSYPGTLFNEPIMATHAQQDNQDVVLRFNG